MVVVCVQCKKPVYDCLAIGSEYSGDSVQAKDFVPLEEGVARPKAGERMECPYCHETFVAGQPSDGGISLLLEGGAWWPHPPIKTS